MMPAPCPRLQAGVGFHRVDLSIMRCTFLLQTAAARTDKLRGYSSRRSAAERSSISKTMRAADVVELPTPLPPPKRQAADSGIFGPVHLGTPGGSRPKGECPKALLKPGLTKDR